MSTYISIIFVLKSLYQVFTSPYTILFGSFKQNSISLSPLLRDFVLSLLCSFRTLFVINCISLSVPAVRYLQLQSIRYAAGWEIILSYLSRCLTARSFRAFPGECQLPKIDITVLSAMIQVAPFDLQFGRPGSGQPSRTVDCDVCARTVRSKNSKMDFCWRKSETRHICMHICLSSLIMIMNFAGGRWKDNEFLRFGHFTR